MKIAVLSGGTSTERDVSLTTGKGVCKALREKGHKAVLIDVFLGISGDVSDIFDKEQDLEGMVQGIGLVEPDIEKIKELRGGDSACFLGENVIEICRMADITFMALHGAEGENGKLQATFDILGIKYTGSGYMGSALAMDKGIAKKIFQDENIQTPKGFLVRASEQKRTYTLKNGVSYPCVVKPCCGGSSVGVSIVENDKEYADALKKAFAFEEEILVEEYIKGREFSIGVVAGKSVPVIEIIPKEGFYDYETKYQAGMAQDVCPAELDKEQTERMQKLAERVFHVLKLESYARIDFLLDGNGVMYCLEANTLPGMTPTSLLPQEMLVLGVSYGELCERIIEESLKKYN